MREIITEIKTTFECPFTSRHNIKMFIILHFYLEKRFVCLSVFCLNFNLNSIRINENKNNENDQAQVKQNIFFLIVFVFIFEFYSHIINL